MKNEANIYRGIDVSKLYLDLNDRGASVRFPNTIKGVASIIKKWGKVHYVLESTGGYERMAAWTLIAHGAPVSVVNPARVRHHALSMGQLAKTDKIDAQMITSYANLTSPSPMKKPSKKQRELTSLVDRRQQLTEMRVSENNRLDTAPDPLFCKLVKQFVKSLDKQIKDIESKIIKIIAEDTDLKNKADRITAIKGLGIISAVTLLAHLPEIGTLTRQEVAALAGLAPYNRDSGNSSHARHICGGRKRLRGCLYMAAVSAIQHNPVMKEFYQRLVNENHRPKKVALTAVMRKLVIAANSAVKNPDLELAV